jgi:hypothetical protein
MNHCILEKLNSRGMSFFMRGRKRERSSVDKLTDVRAGNHYNYDGSGNLCASVESKSSYLKILKIQDSHMLNKLQYQNFLNR